jgi:hypothetical protein
MLVWILDAQAPSNKELAGTLLEVKMYNVKEVHYRDVFGKLIWKDNIVFRRLWGVGNELVHESKQYIVRRVAVADEVQHVNIELVNDWSQLTPDAADGAKAGETLRYWQHDETGRQCARAQRPSPRWFEITKGQYDGSDDDYPAKPPRR